MKTQKFFNVEVVFTNQEHFIGRNVLESWLQFFADTDLKGKPLAEFIGCARLHVIRIGFPTSEKWWEEAFAVTKMQLL